LPKEVQVDLSRELAEAAKAVGLLLSSMTLTIDEERAVIRASWAGSSHYPVSLALVAAKLLHDRGRYVKRIEVISESAVTPSLPTPSRPRVALSLGSPEVSRLLAIVADSCFKRGYYVEGIDIKLRRGPPALRLEVLVPHSRAVRTEPSSYKRIPQELADEIRREVLEVLKRDAEVRVLAVVSTARGTEEYEGRAP